MNMIKKYKTVVAASLILALTQSGCLCGIVVWPLWIAGSAVGVIGLTMGAAGLHYERDDLLRDGLEIALCGVLLDEKNPAHVEALNEIPRDAKLARKLAVSIDDMSDYNDNLNQIQVLGKRMIGDLKPLIKRIKNNEISPSQITSDPQINEIAHRYGFGSAAELMSTQHSKVLPRAYLESFAQATELSVPQAKIFLYHSFGIQAE